MQGIGARVYDFELSVEFTLEFEGEPEFCNCWVHF